MDTTEKYNNIVKALGKSTLDYKKQQENYDTFNKLMAEGVYLPDLMKKVGEIDDLKKRLENIETKPNRIDEELFSVMEQAVKNEPSVKVARQKAADVKSSIISEYCLKDARYKEALDEYRRAVNAAYIQHKEKVDGRTAPVVRADTTRESKDEESVSVSP